jgi:hypothetical protein
MIENKGWSIEQLKEAMNNVLKTCGTDHERQLCRLMCLTYIREMGKIRKLTPTEETVIDDIIGDIYSPASNN